MSTLYIRLPSKATTGNAAHVADLTCQFAYASVGGAIEREGVSVLSQLVDVVLKARRVVLLLAASDVTLLRLKVPPLSAARLKAALPNLVEDQLISDPSECTMVAGPSEDGMRTVAVVHHAWLELLAKTLIELGARNVAAVPMQLCLPYDPDMVAAAVAEHNGDNDVALRLTEDGGIGLSIQSAQDAGADTDAGAAQEIVQTLCALVPDAPIALYVQQSHVTHYQAAVNEAEVHERIAVFSDNWSHWIAGAKNLPLNLMAGLGMSTSQGVNWSNWRWPLILVTACLVINIAGLNVDWLRMKREAATLKASMTQIYKSAYPKETVIQDPMAQMRQKISQAQHEAGLPSPDDFTTMTATFAEVWESVMQGRKTPSIAALEYNERSLLVRLNADGEAPTASMKAALSARNLALTQQKANEWQIRSGK